MPNISSGAVHHIVLTVADRERSRDFYTSVLGFQFLTDYQFSPESGSRYFLSNGTMILAVGLAPDASRAIQGDRFDENRVGLDHVSLHVANRDELEKALKLFEERGITHGEIVDVADFGIYVLAFRDPDNIQVELTAPKT